MHGKGYMPMQCVMAECVEALTSQPVASERLAILTRGVLPIKPATP